jgi:hypothetical protein
MPDTRHRPERSRFLTALGSTTLLVALVLGSASIAGAVDEKPWTSVGSAGTVDEDSLDRILLHTAIAQVRDTGPASVSTVRYNIVAVEGLFGGDGGINLTARFLDAHDDDQVLLLLRQSSVLTGALTTLVVLDSNDYPPSFSYQTRSVCNPDGRFDFSQNAYYIEAILTKAAARREAGKGGLQVLLTPALAILQVTGACLVAPPA